VEKQCLWHDFFIISGETQFMKLPIQTRRRRNFLVVLFLKVRHRFSSEIQGPSVDFFRMYDANKRLHKMRIG
jgi:hypothetical protein